MANTEKATIVRHSRNHYYVQFGRGKSIKKCHKCGTIRHRESKLTYYEKNGVRLEHSPECNETIYG